MSDDARKRWRGPRVGWRPSARYPRQIGVLSDLVSRVAQHVREKTWPRGVRGLFYDLRGVKDGYCTYRKWDKTASPKGDVCSNAECGKRYRTHEPERRCGRCGAGCNPGFAENEAHQDSVQDTLLFARKSGLIAEHLVADTRAPEPIGAPVFDDADDFGWHVAHWAEGFMLDQQDGQPVYVEVLCEAEDLMARLATIARDEFGVVTYSGAGFGGEKAARALAERAKARDVPTLVLGVVDFDKAGDDGFVAAAENTIAWAAWDGCWHLGDDGDPQTRAEDAPQTPIEGAIMPYDLDWLHDLREGEATATVRELRDGKFTGGASVAVPADEPFLLFVKMALTAAQAEDLGLLDAKGKAEVDSAPVGVIHALLREALASVQDGTARRSLIARQEAERTRLPFASRRALWKAEGTPLAEAWLRDTLSELGEPDLLAALAHLPEHARRDLDAIRRVLS